MEAAASRISWLRIRFFKSRFFLIVLYLLIVYLTAWNTFYFESWLHKVFPQFKNVIYPGATPEELFIDHLKITFYSSFGALVFSCIFSALIFTRFFADFKKLIIDLASFLQTIPSVAIIGVVIPVLGYGLIPIVIALVAYSILPVTLNIVRGLESVPEFYLETAEALGLSKSFIFFKVKLPLAAPVIIAGIKNMLIINVSAATMGALVGAGGLGVPIMAGIHDFNPAFIIQGSVPTAAMALLIDELLKIGEGYA